MTYSFCFCLYVYLLNKWLFINLHGWPYIQITIKYLPKANKLLILKDWCDSVKPNPTPTNTTYDHTNTFPYKLNICICFRYYLFRFFFLYIFSTTVLYMKFLVLWAIVITADFMFMFRFEFLWPFWLLLRSVHDSFKYKGLVCSNVIFKCLFWNLHLQFLFFYL